jgi:hypothetical protein
VTARRRGPSGGDGDGIGGGGVVPTTLEVVGVVVASKRA